MPHLLSKKMIQQVQEEPYRLFFPLGIFMALVGVGHWPAYSIGSVQKYSAFFHSSMQTQLYMTCFILGFLMTAMPKFASAHHATRGEVLWFLALILVSAVMLCFGQWISSQTAFATILLSFLVFIKKRIPARTMRTGMIPPMEFIWIPIAIFHGVVGIVSMISVEVGLLPSSWYQTVKILIDQGFILCIVIGVGGFLAPRLMGTFRSYMKTGQMPNDPAILRFRRSVFVFHGICGALFFTSFWIKSQNFQTAYFLRAMIITAQYLWTCSWLRPPRSPDLYAKLIWLSLWLVALGSWLAAFFPQYRTAMLHVIFIGGFSLMIFSVATMVVLTHGGHPEKIRRPLGILWICGLGVAGSLSFRVAASFFPDFYFTLIGIAGLIWVFTALLWLLYTLPYIAKAMTAQELEQCHEDSKMRVAKLRATLSDNCSSSSKCCGHEDKS